MKKRNRARMPSWQHLGWVNSYHGGPGEAGWESARFWPSGCRADSRFEDHWWVPSDLRHFCSFCCIHSCPNPFIHVFVHSSTDLSIHTLKQQSVPEHPLFPSRVLMLQSPQWKRVSREREDVKEVMMGTNTR